ncbi:MAG: hypothetical protein L3J59_16145 [Methylococcaceae bacterium]|nr:hypothetical protein [Methylococcaceae bacterium]
MNLYRIIFLLSTLLIISACVAKKTPANRQSTYPEIIAGPLLSNTCANNVQQQFQQAKANGLTWTQFPWKFNWDKSYAPNSTKPTQFMNNYLYKHVQGFVKTNSEKFPFVGSHSNKGDGGIFILKRNANGLLELASLHLAETPHPSGVQIIGKFIVYGDSGDLVFKDINSLNQANNIRLSIEPAVYGGGLGLIQLKKGSYLIITTGPGGDNKSKARKNYFYEFSMGEAGPDHLNYINSSPVTIPSGWSPDYKLSENLSVVKECNSGDVYTVHASGEVKNILGKLAPFGNDSYWRLSKLKKQNGKYSLESIDFLEEKQNLKSCNPRAAGTVSVNSKNNLEFFCHQHSQKKDASSEDKYYFERGVIISFH